MILAFPVDHIIVLKNKSVLKKKKKCSLFLVFHTYRGKKSELIPPVTRNVPPPTAPDSPTFSSSCVGATSKEKYQNHGEGQRKDVAVVMHMYIHIIKISKRFFLASEDVQNKE